MNITLGSLFDGIGGFPYAGTFLGITPIWASEIEPWPIKVTEKHFPNMKHLGDITKINGAEIEPVDIITFGSPCQDLSVAGKREGLAGERSGLFMEAVRIIREMRTATDGQYPRFAVWENVPGAFSSNKGEDFRAVLEEIAEAEIPMPTSGKWAEAGMVRTERIDIAWRTLDAQYWGVAQRRKRIFLVADFAGQCASEILFIEEGLRGNTQESGETREEVAGAVGNGLKTAGGNDVTATITASYGTKWNGNSGADTGDNFVLSAAIPQTKGQAVASFISGNTGSIGYDEILAPTLKSDAGGNTVPAVVIGFDNQTGKSEGIEVSPAIRSESHGSLPCVASGIIPFNTGQITSPQNGNNPKPGDPCHTLCANEHIPAIAIPQRQINCTPDGITGAVSSKWAKGTGGTAGDECYNLIIEPQLYDMTHADEVMRPVKEGIAPTLNSRMGTGGNQVPVMLAFTQNQRDEVRDLGDKSGALATKPGMKQQTFIYGICSDSSNSMKSSNPHSGIYKADTTRTLDLNGGNPACNQGGMVIVQHYAVRRLTPLECLRLQGFPDYWLDIKGMSDTAKYKAIGNSVAIPCVKFVLGGIARVLQI